MTSKIGDNSSIEEILLILPFSAIEMPPVSSDTIRQIQLGLVSEIPKAALCLVPYCQGLSFGFSVIGKMTEAA